MFPFPATSRCSLLVGKTEEDVRAKREMSLRCSGTRKSRAMPCGRSMYGKGGWLQVPAYASPSGVKSR